MPVVLPFHPRTRAPLTREKLLDRCSPNLRLLDPLGYLDMVMLERHASVIATDSGGIQKEAFFHRVPCVTLRPETEWIELLSSGWNRLAPPINTETIEAGVEAALASTPHSGDHLFGEGCSAERMTDILLKNHSAC